MNFDLPATVPSDPSDARNERDVRAKVEELTLQRDIALAREHAARLMPFVERPYDIHQQPLPFPEQDVPDDLADAIAEAIKLMEAESPPDTSAIDWDSFDREVDELSGSTVRALLKREARLRADQVQRTGGALATVAGGP